MKSIPRIFNFADFLPRPEPPVIKVKFEKKCDPINTKAKVTRPKFRPFNRTAIGEISTPIKAATIPESGSHINKSISNPITLLVATPPNTADVYVPIPTNTP